MTRPRPLRIGLSPRLMHNPPAELGFRGKSLQYLEQSVADWIMSQGALVFMVPTLVSSAEVRRAAVHVSDYVREIDALVLQGG
ncbi:MAG: gamma-glutamyl-gamma-aminobutyrate hydrolase family protein, partial [Gammaproteobacteria bacterium]|nr:gamma-glutamyl-gamma-aminobutyrate hydrolase family protein [Gammaproteobacteria bacterium]